MGLIEDLLGAVEGVPSTVEGWANAVGNVATKPIPWSSIGNSIGNDVASIPGDVSGWAHKLGLIGGTPDPTTPVSTGAGQTSQADSVPSPGQPGAPPGQPTPAAPTQTLAQALSTQEQSISSKAMDSLLAEYSTAMGQVDPYISGAVGLADTGKATQIGRAIGGSGVQAVNPANNAQLNADAQAFTKANDAGATGVASALGNLRQADVAALGVSPYAGLLTALTSGASYRAETQPTPGASPVAGSNMPAWLQSAYNQGITNYGLSATGATTPNAASNSTGLTPSTTPSTTTSGPTGGP